MSLQRDVRGSRGAWKEPHQERLVGGVSGISQLSKRRGGGGNSLQVAPGTLAHHSYLLMPLGVVIWVDW